MTIVCKSAFLTPVLLLALAGNQVLPQTSEKPIQPAPASTSQENSPKKDPTPDEIIKAFSAKETEFYEAWIQYTYRQTLEVRIISVNDVPSHERLNIVSDIVFRDDGTREVRAVDRSGALRSVGFTKEDEEVINNIQPFALTTKDLPLYNLKYEGRERIDELDCYVFAVKPRETKKDKLYFEGRIWVDDQDLQVVMTRGKPVPQKSNNLFPDFETRREIIDGKYWFPTWTHADSVLNFPSQRVHVEETITYENFKRFGSKTKIEYGNPQ
jgi:hypothetical protein